MIKEHTFYNHKGCLVLFEDTWGYFIYPDHDVHGNPNICIAEVHRRNKRLFWKKTKKLSGNRRLYINKELVNDVMAALLKLSGEKSATLDIRADVKEKTDKETVSDFFGRRRF